MGQRSTENRSSGTSRPSTLALVWAFDNRRAVSVTWLQRNSTTEARAPVDVRWPLRGQLARARELKYRTTERPDRLVFHVRALSRSRLRREVDGCHGGD